MKKVVFASVMFLAVQSFAGGGDVEKAQEKVAKADSNDYTAYAMGAEVCIDRGENLDEAFSWLKQSLEIKETPYNLELMGDYYKVTGEKRKAYIYYVSAMEKAREVNPEYKDNKLARKIRRVTDLG